ncbi:MAG TPA: perosamine synthetase [Planctomycetales bacterium]|jgi:dTDP-4-amino-4,6-dideoxygalactose transaminase|nr:perosamine synthetase [Planctomycetales bacterium]
MNPPESPPALLGGPPIRPAGPPDWPAADEEVGEVLRSAWRDGSWGKYQGGAVERLELRLAHEHGVAHAAVCSSGTLAIELALRALKVGPGDEVILAAYDYPGNFLAVHAVGARPVLADVAPDDWNLDLTSVAEAFSPATRAVIASHLHGGLIPMRELTALAAAHGSAVIEDAAQAPGAMVQGRRAGAWGDIGVLSFGGSKLVSAGRGGTLLTGRADLYQRLRLILHRAGNLLYPLSELQAVVLAPQFDRLDERNMRRRRTVALLADHLRDVPGLRLIRPRMVDGEPCYYKVGFQFDAERFGLTRTRFTAAVRMEGIALDPGFRALHIGRSPARLRRVGSLAEAERAHDGAVVLHHPILLADDTDVVQVADAIRKVHRWNTQLAVL